MSKENGPSASLTKVGGFLKRCKIQNKNDNEKCKRGPDPQLGVIFFIEHIESKSKPAFPRFLMKIFEPSLSFCILKITCSVLQIYKSTPNLYKIICSMLRIKHDSFVMTLQDLR